jgi:signal transduction histidine kinase/ActR/RegA family two-component response regulator
MFRNLSITRKQMVIATVASSVALLLACAAFVIYDVVSFRRVMVDNLASLAAVIGDSSTAALTFNDPFVAREILKSLNNQPHIVAACTYDKNGRPFASYHRNPAQKGLIFPAAQPDGYEFGDDRLAMFRHIALKGERLGAIYIQSDLEELADRLRQYVSITVVVLLVSLLAGLALSSRLQRLVSEPILKLAATAKAVSSHKNYSVRALKTGEDELGQLIDGFNEMLGQIQARDAALQTAHDHLERRVEERTRELQQEIAERRRAEEGLQQQVTRISLLNSITRAIADRQDLESVVHVVLRQLEENLPIDFGSVYLFDPRTQTITDAGRGGDQRAAKSDPVLFGNGVPIELTGLQACLRGETISFSDTSDGGFAIQQELSALSLRSAIAVPLMVENELFGILLAARRAVSAFSAGESEFLRMLSEQVALAAHQARLHAQLRRAYDELRQTQKAVMQEERLRALGQMASGIAHDINNALCPIVVYSDLLLCSAPNLKKPFRKQLQSIKTAGEDIAHIVSRMREFYRRRDKRDAVTAVDLNELAGEVIALTRPRWRDMPQSRGIMVEMETDFDPTLPAIAGNESELREAITNLILNAVDALPDGGALSLRSGVRGWDQRGDARRPSTHVFLEVCDTGVGMDEQTRKRCLEPFFSTKGQRGTGLGLAMVYGIVERHEGSIEIESEPGKGTTMRLVFPIGEAHPAAAAAPDSVASGPSLKVLCIDDEPLLREMLQQILEHGGHRAVVADSGKGALELFRVARESGEPFDAVITDLGMPYLDGRQVAKALKHESSTTPIIMLTGWGTIMKEDGDFPAQVDGVLSKPPRIGELLNLLAKVTKLRAAA